MMRVISLIPLSKRAKQSVKQHGDLWEVVRREARVLFTTAEGPFLLVQPLTEDRAPACDMRSARIETASRWVHEFSDEDFKIAP